MKRTVILSAIFTLFLATMVSAQVQTTNFTGNWELDAGKSDLDERMRGKAMSMSVTQTNTELKIENTTKRTRFLDEGMANNAATTNRGGIGRGGFIEGTVIYNLYGDGTKTETNAERGSSIILKAEFENGGKLRLTNSRNFNSQATNAAVANTASVAGGIAAFRSMTVKETWELADGGKTLKILREIETPRGTDSSQLFFTKKDSTNVADTQTAPQPQAPTQISGGVVNSKAINLVKPKYPVEAREAKAGGAVNVQVVIDEQGNVVSAQAISGNTLLWTAAQEAAQASKFSPTKLQGAPVKVSGIIVYNFVP